MDAKRHSELKDICRLVRRDVLEMCERTSSGHVGSAFSVVEILVALYFEAMHADPKDPERDIAILSKGHACAAQYSVLHRKGIMPDDRFASFSVNGSVLGHHPHWEPAIGLEGNMGSLGHGLPIAAGMAYAASKQKSKAKFFAIMSDGETEEGSVWEAAMFAAHHKLSNLCAIVDANGIQALGNTRDIVFPAPQPQRWHGFGWRVEEVDGHDLKQLASALSKAGEPGGPLVVVANTVKGKGVSFMENKLLWHYRQPKGEEFLAAMKELEK
ncbi:MAG: transketolase [Elusimicrobia bacterium]|nr:transketolase [Elusimicrobiota bacterium]